MLLNVWFLIVLSLPAGFALAGEHSSAWWQGVAWLAGAAFWLAGALVGWLLHGRKDRPQWISEIPGDISRRALTGPMVAFAVIRAVATGVTVGLAFALDLPNGIWLPIATFVAVKPSLEQTRLVAAQHVAGALIGALVAAALLVTVDVKPVLVVVTLLALTSAAAIRTVNYALYQAALSAAVLVALELPHFTGLSVEGERVLWTLAGCAVGILMPRADRSYARTVAASLSQENSSMPAKRCACSMVRLTTCPSASRSTATFSSSARVSTGVPPNSTSAVSVSAKYLTCMATPRKRDRPSPQCAHRRMRPSA